MFTQSPSDPLPFKISDITDPQKQRQLRFLFYSHDGQGLGHTRRNLTIAAALRELAPKAAILLVTGLDEVHRFHIPENVGILQLPSLRKVANGWYEGRRLHIPQPDLWALRSSLLTAAVGSFHPDVVLADKHPLGVNGELRDALDLLQARGGKMALGLRDILDNRVTVLSEWASYDLHSRIATYYDRVLIYGHEFVFNPVEQYDFPATVAARTWFCGYVVNGAAQDTHDDSLQLPLAGLPRDRPIVLASAGGGEDGLAFLQTFIKATAGAPWHGVVVAGPMASAEDQRTLQRLAAEVGVTFYTFVTGLVDWFGAVDALVCMGGYNTLAEAVSRGTPTVCVPRMVPRTEQLIRAQAFARLGLLQCIEPADLAVERLRAEIAAALAASPQEFARRAGAVMQFDGARRAACQLLALAEQRTITEPVAPERLST